MPDKPSGEETIDTSTLLTGTGVTGHVGRGLDDLGKHEDPSAPEHASSPEEMAAREAHRVQELIVAFGNTLMRTGIPASSRGKWSRGIHMLYNLITGDENDITQNVIGIKIKQALERDLPNLAEEDLIIPTEVIEYARNATMIEAMRRLGFSDTTFQLLLHRAEILRKKHEAENRDATDDEEASYHRPVVDIMTRQIMTGEATNDLKQTLALLLDLWINDQTDGNIQYMPLETLPTDMQHTLDQALQNLLVAPRLNMGPSKIRVHQILQAIEDNMAQAIESVQRQTAMEQQGQPQADGENGIPQLSPSQAFQQFLPVLLMTDPENHQGWPAIYQGLNAYHQALFGESYTPQDPTQMSLREIADLRNKIIQTNFQTIGFSSTASSLLIQMAHASKQKLESWMEDTPTDERAFAEDQLIDRLVTDLIRNLEILTDLFAQSSNPGESTIVALYEVDNGKWLDNARDIFKKLLSAPLFEFFNYQDKVTHLCNEIENSMPTQDDAIALNDTETTDETTETRPLLKRTLQEVFTEFKVKFTIWSNQLPQL